MRLLTSFMLLLPLQERSLTDLEGVFPEEIVYNSTLKPYDLLLLELQRNG